MKQVRYRIQHDTHYRYEAPVSLSQQLLHLLPRDCAWQRCLSQQLAILPAPTQRQEAWDAFGNPLTRLSFERPHDELYVGTDLEVEVDSRAGWVLEDSPAWEEVREGLRYPAATVALDVHHFRFESPAVPIDRIFARFAADCFPPGQPLLLGCRALMEKIHREFRFDATATQVATPLREVLEHRHGVCQDFAHLMLACLRGLGLVARYVSGYLLTQPPPGKPRLIGADASHAWVSVHCPVLGWVDFDPTNDVLPDVEHITLAWGRDFTDVSPLRGVILGGGDHDPVVEVTVTPL
ncbi:transglutaminase family protein [Pseudomonas oryzihabitans]|uniref:transglutaminase family protein n=1 Tax=Pseudomonas oryzihabitans TaxID=47885 RepID=UPI00289589E5|nr:transglutaminase family protein [Pseudomonas oryzihabitans]MDT3718393.1 transglutaminase family protein [Pseudomonas oryzihabitans]